MNRMEAETLSRNLTLDSNTTGHYDARINKDGSWHVTKWIGSKIVLTLNDISDCPCSNTRSLNTGVGMIRDFVCIDCGKEFEKDVS